MDWPGSEVSSPVESVKPKGLLEAMVQMKRPIVIAFLFPFAGTLTASVGASFMRTIVHCAPPLPDKQDQCPSGSFFNLGHCEAAPRSSSDWSFSSHCADRAYVVMTATATTGKMMLAGQAAQIVGVGVLGPQLDIWGRRPLVLLASVIYFVGGGLVLASTFVTNAWAQFLLIMASVAVPMLFDVSQAACRAMVADLSKASALERSLGFAAMRLVSLKGGLAAMGACSYILSLNLDNYRPIWVAHCLMTLLIAGIVATVLKETLVKGPDAAGPSEDEISPTGDEISPTGASEDARSRRGALFGVHEMCRQVAQASCLAWEDPLLGHITVMGGVLQGVTMGTASTVGAYLLEALRYSQAMTQVPGMVCPLIGLVSTCLCPHIVRRRGAARACETGFLLCAVGFAFLGLSALCMRAADAFFWLGLLIMSFGASFPSVCMLAVMSIRVDASSQGKLDALSQFGGLLGGLLGTYVWTHRLYAGWRIGLIFWPAAAVHLATMLWFRTACRLWPNPPALAAVPAKTPV